jgi:serine/threonine protein kinase
VTVATEIRRGTLVDNRYRIQRILGTGGFGRTYLVSDRRRFDEFCVLKEFLPSTPSQTLIQRARELFQREAKVLYELEHPQIPKFLAWCEENGRLFLVQEYVDGKTYSEILQERTFSETEVIQWLLDLLPVLDYLHSCNIIHRDISPDNIMLPSYGTKPMLIDLGVVKQFMSEVRSGSLRSTTNTGYALLVGKVGFSPPEQIDRGQCYPNSDLYALAVSALVMLTGKEPTEQVNTNAWIGNDLKIGDRFAQILAKMLAENPIERFLSAKEVLAELQKIQPNMPEIPIPAPAIEPPSSPTLPVVPAQEFVRRTLIQTKTQLQELPQAIKQSSKKMSLAGFLTMPGKGFALGACCSALLLGTILIASQSPQIPALCKTLDNCARDKEFEEIYAQELEEGKTLISGIEEAQNVNQLQTIRDRISIAIIRLSTIPQDVAVYQDARKLLGEYQNYLNLTQTELTKEDSAQKQLATIDRLSDTAAQQTATANSVTQYQEAKNEWEKIQQRLKTIPSNTFVRDEVQAQLQEANTKIKTIQAEIEQRVTQAEKKLEQVTQQAKQQRIEQITEVRASATKALSTPPVVRVTQPQVKPKPKVSTSPTYNPPKKDNPAIETATRPTLPPLKPIAVKPEKVTPPPAPVNEPVAIQETTNNQPTTRRVISYRQSERDIAIAYANDIAYGLVVAGQRGEINYRTRMYRKAQNTIRWLRRGKTLEEAARLSNVPMSVVEQLVQWGQSRPSARITQESPQVASE